MEKGKYENCLKQFGVTKFQGKCEWSENSGEERTEMVTLNWERSLNAAPSSSKIIQLPVPYELPPQPYTSEGLCYSFYLFWLTLYNLLLLLLLKRVYIKSQY